MTDETPLTHIALFWLKRPASMEDRALLIAGLETLRAVPPVRSLHIGIPARTDARDVVDHTWSVGLTTTFASLTDEETYQTHPVHLAFVERCEHLWDKVVVYDIVDAPGA